MHLLYSKIAKEEIDKNRFLVDTIKDDNIKNRFKTSLEWFIEKSVKAKYWFFVFSVITIITPVISSIILDLQDCDCIIKISVSILSALTSISASFLNLFSCRNNWILYRNQAEKIKHILAIHINNPDYTEEKMLNDLESSTAFTDETFIKNTEKKQ